MLSRVSPQKLDQNICKKFLLSPTELYLPWLCPALFTKKRSQRSSSTVASSSIGLNARLPSRQSSPTRQAQTRALGTNLVSVSSPDQYIPFDGPQSSQPLGELQFPWLSIDPRFPDQTTSDTPLIINDSTATRPPRFRAVDGISGELAEIVSTMRACLHVGRFERAAALMRRLNSIFKPDAPGLLAAHNDYVRELAWKVTSTKDQQVLRDLQTWFEVELRGRGFIVNATTYAYLIQAALQDVSTSKSQRSIRRYLHLAESDGLYLDLLNTLNTVLNVQDFGRVTRIDAPTLESDVKDAIVPLPASKHSGSNLPEIRSANSNLPKFRALRQSLSVFSDSSAIPPLDAFEGTAEEMTNILALKRQLRIEKDTYNSAVEMWRTDYEHLKSIGINTKLKQNSFGAAMWGWHESLEPAIREEIKLANQAESKAVKTSADEDRCRYGPFLQYLKPEKLSAITILNCMMSIGAGCKTEQGISITGLVMKIGTAVHSESVAEYLKSNPSRPDFVDQTSRKKGFRKWRAIDETQIPFRSPTQALEGQEWGPAMKARVGAVLLSKLMECAKVQVNLQPNELGQIIREWQPAFLHQFTYHGGRRRGMLALNGSLYDRLSREPVGASVDQKHLPMIVEPKPWKGFWDGGYLTSSEKMVRMSEGNEQNRGYIKTAIENGDMDQVSAGLDVLARTPWQINGPVFEVMLEAWNSGEAIGKIAPEDPKIEVPPEPTDADKVVYGKYLYQMRRISNLKYSYRSQRCYQNFQIEIARAFLDETFYFPHNVDFRGRAYPMSPFFNYMGADLCRGILTFGIGKELGPGGLKWLKIHLANVYGFDKASFAERVTFVENHLSDIFDSANEPLQGRRWWLEAQDPWQCLAACKELQNALKSPDPHRFVSKLAIHQDGTCNGLQHYAALGGDSLGARQVNLEPGDRPSDIYTGVAELVKEDINNDAKQGHELAKALEGRISRKVVKQTVMTNVYGVTFIGARAQVLKQLKELHPDFPQTETVTHSYAALYIARKVFKALANIFNGAHDIQYWLGDCAARIAASVTPEQMTRIEAARAGSLNESTDFQRTPLKGKNRCGRSDELVSFKQSVIWTTPLKMPVVQPYRQSQSKTISTNLQLISLMSPSLTDPVNKRKQLQAFPPNFIHSLDATHMLLSALACHKQGLTFTAVHDSFWTHASDVDVMNGILRDAFIEMHSEDIIGRLGAEFAIRYKGCMHLSAVKANSQTGEKIRAWRLKRVDARQQRKQKVQENMRISELLQERRRLRLLASKNAEERKEGEAMMTAYSIFEQSAGEEDLAGKDDDLADLALGNTSPARENKLQADERLTVGHEDNIGIGPPGMIDEAEVLDEMADGHTAAEESMETEGMSSGSSESKAKTETRRASPMKKIWLWRPLTFPPVPKKGDFDVTKIKSSQYFFS